MHRNPLGDIEGTSPYAVNKAATVVWSPRQEMPPRKLARSDFSGQSLCSADKDLLYKDKEHKGVQLLTFHVEIQLCLEMIFKHFWVTESHFI